MARRKRKEDVPEWSPPEFDEVGFMRQEIAGAKAAVVTIAWAAVGAVISFLLFGITWVIAFFAGLLTFAALYYVMPKLGVRTTGFKRKDWAGHAVTYFFSWLAFWVLLLNVPVSDITAPTINYLYAGAYSAAAGEDAGVTCIPPTGGTIAVSMGANDTLYFLFRATDNVAITGLLVKVNGGTVTPEPKAGGTNVCRGQQANLPRYADGTYVVRIPQTGSSFTIEITASDAAGHTVAAGVQIQAQP